MTTQRLDRDTITELSAAAYEKAMDAYRRRDAKTGDVYAEITGFLDGVAFGMPCSCEQEPES